jgi:hypothetical protein
MSISPRRTALALAFFSAVPLLAACPEKKPVPFDAGPPPPPPPVEDAAPMLQEMPVDDAGPDTGADAGKPRATGPGVNTNVARLKQCCNQLAITGKGMGNSPEGAMFNSAAAQCNTMAAQVGPTGTAPELGVIRGLLAGRTIPAACAGF